MRVILRWSSLEIHWPADAIMMIADVPAPNWCQFINYHADSLLMADHDSLFTWTILCKIQTALQPLSGTILCMHQANERRLLACKVVSHWCIHYANEIWCYNVNVISHWLGAYTKWSLHYTNDVRRGWEASNWLVSILLMGPSFHTHTILWGMGCLWKHWRQLLLCDASSDDL